MNVLSDSSEKKERELQIKLAKLNAELQIDIAAVFGFIAVAVGTILFAYQLGLDSLGTWSAKTVISILLFIFAASVGFAALWYSKRLLACEKEFHELK